MIDTIADAEGISMGSVSFKAQFGKGTFFKLDYTGFRSFPDICSYIATVIL